MLVKYVAAVDLLARALEESAVLSAFHPVVFLKVTDVSESQSRNADQPMLVTEAGIVIVVSE